MSISQRMKWPYPSEGADPWYDAFEGLVSAQDASFAALNEAKNVIISSDAIFSWNSATNILSWNNTIVLNSPYTGLNEVIPAGSLTLQPTDGIGYVCFVNSPLSTVTLSMKADARVAPADIDSALVVFKRVGSALLFRNGARLDSGGNAPIFASNLTGAAGGSLTGSYPNPTIAPGVIRNAEVASDAAISTSKISGLLTDIAGNGLAAALGNLTRVAQVYYVTTAGNDSTGDGSISTPFASINRAITQASTDYSEGTMVCISVGPGTFSGAVSIARYNTLIQGVGHRADMPMTKIVGNVTINPTNATNKTAHVVGLDGLRIDPLSGAAVKVTGTTLFSTIIHDCYLATTNSSTIANALSCDASNVARPRILVSDSTLITNTAGPNIVQLDRGDVYLSNTQVLQASTVTAGGVGTAITVANNATLWLEDCSLTTQTVGACITATGTATGNKLTVLYSNITTNYTGSANSSHGISLSTGLAAYVYQTTFSVADTDASVNAINGSGIVALTYGSLLFVPGTNTGISAAITKTPMSEVHGTLILPSLDASKPLKLNASNTVEAAAINLDGAEVSGTLPKDKQAAQDVGGDLSGTTATATVTGIQGFPVSNTTPLAGQSYVWSGSEFVPAAVSGGGSGGGGGLAYYLNYNTAGEPPIYAGYDKQFSLSYGTSGQVNTGPITAPALGTEALLAEFVTNVGSPGEITIPPGIWNFNVYLVSSVASGTKFRARLYKWSGGPPTEISASPSDFSIITGAGPDAVQYTASVYIEQTVLASTDRLLVRLEISSTDATTGRTVTGYFNGGTPSHVDTAIGVPGGTGVVKVFAGIPQTPATLIINGDIATGANIAVTKLARGAVNTFLRGNGPSVDNSFSAVNLSTADVTGSLPASKGGTGISGALTPGSVVYAGTTSAMALTAVGAEGNLLLSGGTTTPTWLANGYEGYVLVSKGPFAKPIWSNSVGINGSDFGYFGRDVGSVTTVAVANASTQFTPNSPIISITTSPAGTTILGSQPTIVTTGILEGTRLTIVNETANSIVFQDETVLPGSGIQLGGGNTRTLAPWNSIDFVRASSGDYWIERAVGGSSGGVQSLGFTAPLGNTGTVTDPIVALTGSVPFDKGGTGLSATVTAGGIAYANTTTSLAVSPLISYGQLVVSGGTTTAPYGISNVNAGSVLVSGGTSPGATPSFSNEVGALGSDFKLLGRDVGNANTATLTATTDSFTVNTPIIRVTSVSSANLLLSSTPTIGVTGIASGTRLTIVNEASNSFIIRDESDLPNSKVQLGGTPRRTLAQWQSIDLIYSNGFWVERAVGGSGIVQSIASSAPTPANGLMVVDSTTNPSIPTVGIRGLTNDYPGTANGVVYFDTTSSLTSTTSGVKGSVLISSPSGIPIWREPSSPTTNGLVLTCNSGVTVFAPGVGYTGNDFFYGGKDVGGVTEATISSVSPVIAPTNPILVLDVTVANVIASFNTTVTSGTRMTLVIKSTSAYSLPLYDHRHAPPNTYILLDGGRDKILTPGSSIDLVFYGGLWRERATTPIPYDIASEVVGKPPANTTVMRFTATRSITLSSTDTDHRFRAQTGANSNSTFTLYRKRSGTTVTVLTALFSSGGASPQNATITVTSANTSIQDGDDLYIQSPLTQDLTLSDINWTISGIV